MTMRQVQVKPLKNKPFFMTSSLAEEVNNQGAISTLAYSPFVGESWDERYALQDRFFEICFTSRWFVQ